jgi:hypothetical protein
MLFVGFWVFDKFEIFCLLMDICLNFICVAFQSSLTSVTVSIALQCHFGTVTTKFK